MNWLLRFPHRLRDSAICHAKRTLLLQFHGVKGFVQLLVNCCFFTFLFHVTSVMNVLVVATKMIPRNIVFPWVSCCCNTMIFQTLKLVKYSFKFHKICWLFIVNVYWIYNYATQILSRSNELWLTKIKMPLLRKVMLWWGLGTNVLLMQDVLLINPVCTRR